jgi:exonuclease III
MARDTGQRHGCINSNRIQISVAMKIVSWNVNGWTPTLERLRDRYGGVVGFLEAIATHFSDDRSPGQDGLDGGGLPGGPGGEGAGLGVARGSSDGGGGHAGAEDCILCLQEVKLTSKKLTKETCCMDEQALESFHATSDTRLGYSGTSIFTSVPRWRASRVRYDVFGASDGLDGEGRFVAVDIGRSTGCVLVNVYVPNAGLGKSTGSNVGVAGKRSNGGDVSGSVGHGEGRIGYKMRFYKRLLAFCTRVVEEEQKEVILVGDFNSCFDARDVHPSIGLEHAFLQCELDALRAFTDKGFVDVYRDLHPEAHRAYTCFDQKTNARLYNRGVRIDFCLVSPGLRGRVRRCEIVGRDVVPAAWSDHCALYVDIAVDAGEEGEGESKSLKEWVTLKNKLTNASQKTLLDMFGRTKSSRSLGGDAAVDHNANKKPKAG